MSTAVVVVLAILLTRTKATGYVVVPHLRPTVAFIVAIGIMQTTPLFSPRCWGKFSPDIVPVRLKQFCIRWPRFLQCEQVISAEGVDVTTIADLHPFAFCEGPLRITLLAYILRFVSQLGRG